MKSNHNHVLVLPLGSMQFPAISYLKKIGYQLVGIDGGSHPYCKDFVDIFINADIFNADEILKAIKKFPDLQIKGIVCVSADCHKTVARLSDYFGTKLTWDYSISKICGDKFMTRNFLTDIVKQPKSYEVSSYKELKQLNLAFENNDIVLKSPDSSGSRGFQEFNSVDHIIEEEFLYTKNFSKSKKVIVEEKLTRSKTYTSELSAEAIYFRDQIKILNIVDRIFTNDLDKYNLSSTIQSDNLNSAIEIGHINPTFLPKTKTDEIFDLFVKIFRKIRKISKLELITLKLDILINDNEDLIVLEMTPRCSGGWDSCYSNILIGGNLQKTLIDFLLQRISPSMAFKNFTTTNDYEHRVSVLGIPKSDAKDCIGRVFYSGGIISLKKPVKYVLNKAISKYHKGEALVPISIK